MSVYRFPASVKRKGQSTPQGPHHPDILREIRRLWTTLDPATARQRNGLELLSLGLELLELDAVPELYRDEVANLETHLDALEELAAIGPHLVAAYKRAHAADPEREHLHALKDAINRALYPEQPLGMRACLLEIEGYALRVFAALESIDAADHEQQQVDAPNLELDRPWDRLAWAYSASGLLSGAAHALETSRPPMLDLLEPVCRWLRLELRPAPTMAHLIGFLTEDEASDQREELERELERERRARVVALKTHLEEIANALADELVELVECDRCDRFDAMFEALSAKNGGDAGPDCQLELKLKHAAFPERVDPEPQSEEDRARALARFDTMFEALGAKNGGDA